MTAAYDEFIREYEMTGSEKMDGYSRSVFVGLASHEKLKVFEILQQELPISAPWLFFLDAQKAKSIVMDKEMEWRGDKYKRTFILQENLVEYTGDLAYQARMIEDYPNYVDYLRPEVVDAIGRTPVDLSVFRFFQQVILTEVDADAVARTARRLLAMMKIPRATDIEKENHKKLERDLRSDDTQAKLRIFARMEQQNDGLFAAI